MPPVVRRRPAPRRTAARPARPGRAADAPTAPPPPPLPDLRDPRFALERETLKLVVQEPTAVRRATPRHRRQRLHPPDLPRRLGAGRARRRARAPPTPAGRPACAGARPTRPSPPRCSALAVEPLPSRKGADDAFVANTVYRLQELTAQRRIADVKSRLQRTNPVEHDHRVQPDVRRADRPRAAPASAARPGAGSLVRMRYRPPRAAAGRASRPGSGCSPGPRSSTVAVGRRHPRRALPARRPACRGSRSRPPTGTTTRPAAGQRGRARGGEPRPSTSSPSTSPRRATPTASSSWCASG